MDSDLSMSQAVRELRKAREMTQEKFAADLNVKVLSVRRWESGEFRPAPGVLSRMYRTAKSLERHDLASVFLTGGAPQPAKIPAQRVPPSELWTLRDYFVDIGMFLAQAQSDPSLPEEKRQELRLKALSAAVEGDGFIRQLVGEFAGN